MTLNDPLADALSNIMNHERIAAKECVVRYSKLIERTLKVLKENGYIDSFEVDNESKMRITVKLNGMINSVGVIKPRTTARVNSIEDYEKRYLPAKGFGIVLISTPEGILTHKEAREKNAGGRLLAYCY